VNGYGAMATSASVAALKKVLLPLEGLPTRPIIMFPLRKEKGGQIYNLIYSYLAIRKYINPD